MIIIMSPTKTFNENAKPMKFNMDKMNFKDEIKELTCILNSFTVCELMKLMKISEELGKATYKKYKNFEENEEGYGAIYYFYGESFKGLDIATLDNESVSFGEEHLLILSGLYGAIKPLDLIKPYRLEMGTKLETSKGKDLYKYWRDKLTDYVRKELDKSSGDKILINLASDEYSKALDLKDISKEYKVISIAFKENRDGCYKTIGTYAKKARGLMVRYILQNKIESIEIIKEFKEEGYSFNKEESNSENLIFTR